MIDIEAEVFTKVAEALRETFPNINVNSVTSYNPEKFPAVFIEETDNYSKLDTRDSASNENHAVVVYEVNIYSDKPRTAKSECKAIAQVVDTAFNRLGFTRNAKVPFNSPTATRMRLFMRYSAVVGKDKVIYWR